MKSFKQLLEQLSEAASGHKNRPADRDVGDKTPESMTNGYGNKVKAMHGLQDNPDTSQTPENFEAKLEKKQKVLGDMKTGGRDPMPVVKEGSNGSEDEWNPDNQGYKPWKNSIRVTPTPKMTPKQRMDHDRANHKFKDDIGGHSSNYKKNFGEDFEPGELMLEDGSTVELTEENCDCMNKAAKKKAGKLVVDNMLKNSADFAAGLDLLELSVRKLENYVERSKAEEDRAIKTLGKESTTAPEAKAAFALTKRRDKGIRLASKKIQSFKLREGLTVPKPGEEGTCADCGKELDDAHNCDCNKDLGDGAET